MSALAPAETPETAPTIAAIETTKIRVPLARTYRGSYYSMTFRSTILTRVSTATGILGEAYVGDEDTGIAALDLASRFFRATLAELHQVEPR